MTVLQAHDRKTTPLLVLAGVLFAGGALTGTVSADPSANGGAGGRTAPSRTETVLEQVIIGTAELSHWSLPEARKRELGALILRSADAHENPGCRNDFLDGVIVCGDFTPERKSTQTTETTSFRSNVNHWIRSRDETPFKLTPIEDWTKLPDNRGWSIPLVMDGKQVIVIWYLTSTHDQARQILISFPE
ncbi:MAG: hypothetical protein ACE5IK_07100 [Acidobacteriota bacterium]